MRESRSQYAILCAEVLLASLHWRRLLLTMFAQPIFLVLANLVFVGIHYGGLDERTWLPRFAVGYAKR